MSRNERCISNEYGAFQLPNGAVSLVSRLSNLSGPYLPQHDVETVQERTSVEKRRRSSWLRVLLSD